MVEQVERRSGTTKLLAAEKRTQQLVTGLITTVIALATVVWYMIQGLSTQVAEQSRLMHEVKEDSKIHNEVAGLHIAQIDENKQDIRLLNSDVYARPDPFSGTEGRAMRAALEAKLDKLEERLDQLENDCRIVQYRMDAESIE